jgi:AcrR family transcriptional regulator
MPRRTAADGELTRETLIDAAADLFASQGIEGVSIRSINSHAGLAAAAVHYHFGSKDRLLDAVLEREGSAVRDEINELADRLLARKARPTTRQLVETLATPYLNLIEREPVKGVRWLKIVAQLIAAQDNRVTEQGDVAVVTTKIDELLHRRYPVIADEDLNVDWPLAVTTMIQMLALTPSDQIGVPSSESPYKRTVIDFVVGGLDATVSAAAGKAAKAG